MIIKGDLHQKLSSWAERSSRISLGSKKGYYVFSVASWFCDGDAQLTSAIFDIQKTTIQRWVNGKTFFAGGFLWLKICNHAKCRKSFQRPQETYAKTFRLKLLLLCSRNVASIFDIFGLNPYKTEMVQFGAHLQSLLDYSTYGFLMQHQKKNKLSE